MSIYQTPSLSSPLKVSSAQVKKTHETKSLFETVHKRFCNIHKVTAEQELKESWCLYLCPPPHFSASLSLYALTPNSFPGFSELVWSPIFTLFFVSPFFYLHLNKEKRVGECIRLKYSFLVYQRQAVYSEGQSSSFSWRISIPRPLGRCAVE